MTLQIFVAPQPLGDDSNDGLTQNSPINTLERANRLCHEYVPAHDDDIQVTITPGLYCDQTVRWDYYSPILGDNGGPRFKVIILGTDRGLPTTSQGMPEFRGPAGGRTWFFLPNTRIGELTNIEIRGLFVHHYRNAITSRGSNGTVISGCYFRRIGQQFNGDSIAYGTIILENSNQNRIEKCYFRINGNYYSNDEEDWAQFHGVYLAHHANENIIEGNNFSRLSGHPVKVRDSSNFNEVRGNRFFNVKSGTALQDYYQAPPSKETPSWGNLFEDNEVLSNGNKNLIAVQIWRRVFNCPEGERRTSRVVIQNNFGNPDANGVIFRP